MTRYTGGCACGDIRYEITGEPLGAGQCHCRDCQYASGGGPANAFVVPNDSLRVSKGEPRSYESESAKGNRAVRKFCPRRGTPLFGERSGAPGLTVVMAGSLDDPSVFNPTTVGWVSAAPPWAHIDSRLQAFDRNVGDYPRAATSTSSRVANWYSVPSLSPLATSSLTKMFCGPVRQI